MTTLEIIACHADWRKHSGIAPTIIDGKKYRPVKHEKTRFARCYFCQKSSYGVFTYMEVAEQ